MAPKGKHIRLKCDRQKLKFAGRVRNFYPKGKRKIIPKEYQDAVRDVIELDDELDILSRY